MRVAAIVGVLALALAYGSMGDAQAPALKRVAVASASPTATPTTAVLTYPVNGAFAIDPSQPFQWNSVPGAQAYYLYVGTSPGARDLVHSGAIQTTSLAVQDLVAGQTLYATLFTEIAEQWLPTSASFTIGGVASMVYPANGATDVDPGRAFEWSSALGAQTYYLYVGTSPGAKDVVNSGEITSTTLPVSNLSQYAGRTLYARIYTKRNGLWNYSQASFMVGSMATFIYPTAAGSGVMDPTQAFSWTPVSGAQAYYLIVGTTPGARDVVDSDELQSTSFVAKGLFGGRTLYGRIYTELNNTWHYSQVIFTITGVAAFSTPLDNQNIIGGQTISWTSVSGAQAYYLIIGSSPGARDIVNTGEMQATSYTLPAGLTAGKSVYARIYTELKGIWHYSQAEVSLGPASTFILPVDGATGVDPLQPFLWTAVAGAEKYYLYVGSTPDAKDIINSGEINAVTVSPAQFGSPLPANSTLYALIFSYVNGAWVWSDPISFTTGNGTAEPLCQDSSGSFRCLEAARVMAAQTRNMADASGKPVPNSLLALIVNGRGRSSAVCGDFAETLLDIASIANIGRVRLVNLAFNPNAYDTHVLVEMYDPDQDDWVIIDPNFAITAMRATDGQPATALDFENEVHNQTWYGLSFNFLLPEQSGYLTHYYLDYPLLYNNVYEQGGQPYTLDAGATVLPYLTAVPLPLVSSSSTTYVLRTLSGNPASVYINGVQTSVPCNGTDNVSVAFVASTVSLASGSSSTDIQLYRVNRYLF